MSLPVAQVTSVLSALTVISDVLIVSIVVILISHRLGFTWCGSFLNRLGRDAVPVSFFVALIATLSSLFYSNIAGFPPCSLCWWQRIFLYPQVFILGLAWVKRDIRAGEYALLLSVVGGAIALYHAFIQFGGSPSILCSGDVISCNQRYFLEYGYVTIPTMSLTTFLLISIITLIKRLRRQPN